MNMLRSCPAVLMIVALAGCEEAGVVPTQFQATMRGSSEVPAVTTSATGSATFTVSGSTLQYTITVSGITGATAAHIHLAAVGVAGPVRLDLCGAGATPACAAGTVNGALVTGTNGTVVGTPALTFNDLLVAMGNFGAYVNVHTAANPGGEIRGQIFAR